MEVIYYPDLYVYSQETLKSLLLCWGNIRTIVPRSHMNYIKSYLDGSVKKHINYPLEEYKKVLHLAGEPIIDFLIIRDSERKRASEKMFDLICHWNKNTSFYDSLKINSIDDLVNKWVTWYWFLNEKLEQPLVELLLEEKLVVNLAPGEITGYEEVGKSYMSIIAEEIKRRRNIRLITDDEFPVAAKSGLDLVYLPSEKQREDAYQLVSVAIPQVFIRPSILKSLSWEQVLEIRKDLLPFAESYHRELEEYQLSINSLQKEGKDEEAFDKFREFCERVTISFKPFSIETSRILRLTKNAEAIAFITGITLPAMKLVIPFSQVAQYCDITAISLMASRYALSKSRIPIGFEYLENLNRKLKIKRMKGMITCLVPKTVKRLFPHHKYN